TPQSFGLVRNQTMVDLSGPRCLIKQQFRLLTKPRVNVIDALPESRLEPRSYRNLASPKLYGLSCLERLVKHHKHYVHSSAISAQSGLASDIPLREAWRPKPSLVRLDRVRIKRLPPTQVRGISYRGLRSSSTKRRQHRRHGGRAQQPPASHTGHGRELFGQFLVPGRQGH